MKIVKESLNEIISFERGGDPLFTLGVGKKVLIENWLDEMKIINYKINKDFTIDANIISLCHNNLVKIPDYIQFNKINKGYFDCSWNKLISLRGCPNYVEGTFDCAQNQLTSLKFCPKIVKNNFYCVYNKVQFTKDDVKKLCEVTGNIEVQGF